jgi:G6PDH family F420-dependent oxidoreductase
MQIGLKLFAEGFSPLELVEHAVLAERAGFDFVEISDHFHPWLDRPEDGRLQGHAGFAWSILGAVAARTGRIRLGTGVTCPTHRYHPAIIAQAAATMGILSEDRFFLGIGSGERLNEHIIGGGWQSAATRHAMLREALLIIRLLWSGGFHSYRGKHLQLEDARLYDLPRQLPDIVVAASGKNATRIAATQGDGLFLTSPNAQLIRTFREAGATGPVLAEALIGFESSQELGLQAALKAFRWAELGVATDAEIPRASLFREASRFVRVEDIASDVAAGPDADAYLTLARRYADAGVDGIAFINVGSDMRAFLEFASERLVDPVRRLEPAAGLAHQ